MEGSSLRKPWTIELALWLLWGPMLMFVGVATYRNLSLILQGRSDSIYGHAVLVMFFVVQAYFVILIQAGEKAGRSLLTGMFVTGMLFLFFPILRLFHSFLAGVHQEAFLSCALVFYLGPSCIIGLLHCKPSNWWLDEMDDEPIVVDLQPTQVCVPAFV